jgi:dCMP deaminase
MTDQNRLDKTYMKMAEELSKLSYAERKKVGALVVKDAHIISEGYNGTPAGFDNKCERDTFNYPLYPYQHEPRTKPEVLHAESNAITKLARSTNSSDGATLYVTLSPCFECAKLIIQAGIKRVVYKDRYSPADGIKFLREAGIVVDCIIPGKAR